MVENGEVSLADEDQDDLDLRVGEVMIIQSQTRILRDQGPDRFQAVQIHPPLLQGRLLLVEAAHDQALLLPTVVELVYTNPPQIWLGLEQPAQYLLRSVPIVQYALKICLLVLVVSNLNNCYLYSKISL